MSGIVDAYHAQYAPVWAGVALACLLCLLLILPSDGGPDGYA